MMKYFILEDTFMLVQKRSFICDVKKQNFKNEIDDSKLDYIPFCKTNIIILDISSIK